MPTDSYEAIRFAELKEKPDTVNRYPDVPRYSTVSLRFATGDLAKAEYVDADYLVAARDRCELQEAEIALLKASTGVHQKLRNEANLALKLDPEAVHAVLSALAGSGHLIRELQVTRGLPDNPIDQLIVQYNAWCEQSKTGEPS